MMTKVSIEPTENARKKGRKGRKMRERKERKDRKERKGWTVSPISFTSFSI